MARACLALVRGPGTATVEVDPFTYGSQGHILALVPQPSEAGTNRLISVYKQTNDKVELSSPFAEYDMALKFLDPDHPFFKRVWRRWLTAIFPLGWAIVEIATGNTVWAMLFGGVGVYAFWMLIVKGPSS